MSGLHSLSTIIKRLEAATSRLEDIVVTVNNGDDGRGVIMPDIQPSLSQPSPPPPPPVQQEIPAAVLAYDEKVLTACVAPFVDHTKSFASDGVVSMVGIFEAQMQGVRDLLLISANCQKPSQGELDTLIEPLSKGIDAMSSAKNGNRKERDWFTHLTFVAEAAPTVGWVLSPKPAPYVGDVKDVVDYYGNKIISEWKEKDSKHVDWVKSFVQIFDETKKYVQEYHTTGLTWNNKGMRVQEYKGSRASTTAPPPPVPPPPPPPPPATAAPSKPSAAVDVAAVFADLNRGEDVTKGLRKVDKSEMTHKNPSLRAGGTVPASVSSAPGKKPVKPSKPQALAGKKPSRFELEGNKWLVEHHENADALSINDTEISHVVNIFGCKNTTVVIKNKVNAVTLVNCTKISVLVDSVVSSISITRSPSFQLQVVGTAPMIQIDSTDSGQIYLSRDSLSAEITTAKCSAINVNLPVEGEEDGVFAEQAVPEMLKSVITDGRLVTTVVEHTG